MLQSSESIAGAALSPSGVEPGLAAVLSWEASWGIGAGLLLLGLLYALHVRRQLRLDAQARAVATRNAASGKHV